MKILSFKLFLLSFLLVFSAQAQSEKEDALWVKGGLFRVNLTNIGLFNWAAGGQNTLAVGSGLNLFVNYKRDKMTWDNTIDVNYGVISQSENLDAWYKNDDRLELSGKFGWKVVDKWYYSGLVNFRTQFAPGFKDPFNSEENPISNRMAPGYLLWGVGMDYKPDDHLSVLLNPIASKITFVLDQDLANAGAYGVEKAVVSDAGILVTPGRNSRTELGGLITLAYQNRFKGDSLVLKSKLDLFSNYLDTPQNIDVNWTIDLSFQLTRYLGFSMQTVLLYDDDVRISVTNDAGEEYAGKRTQFKYVFGAGIRYGLGLKKAR